MPKTNLLLNTFNRGVISDLGLARTDLERVSMSASIQDNWMPRVLGSMSLRPGLKYLSSTNGNAKAKFFPFIFSNSDFAFLEFTDSLLRFWISDAPIERAVVATTTTNGNFTSNVTNWTDADETGCTSSWKTGGYLSLVGTKYNKAIRRQQVTVSGGAINTQHALRIVIERGPVLLKIGSSSGGEQYISETELETGTHSLAFTPTGDFHIELAGREQAESLVDSCNVEGGGYASLPTPWLLADLPYLRFDQSGDVVYVACNGYQQRKIIRYGTSSWSIVKYQPEDGPFRVINTTTTRLTPSAISGDITLTASAALFNSDQVGALFKLTSAGQNVEIDVNGAGQWSDSVRVTGTSTQRDITVTRAGTWSATVTLQRSIGDTSSWVDVTTYTTNATVNYNDGLDNQIIYYRIGVDTGDYTSGTAELSLSNTTGGIVGVVRITAFTSSTSVSAAVIKTLGAATATEAWEEGDWSEYRGWPSAVALHNGRLCWGGKGKLWCSVSDAYESFDPDTEGDSGPIRTFIGSGPVDNINWLLSLNKLHIGADGAEWIAKSSNLDEPITPSNISLKSPSSQGSAAVQAIKIDNVALFVQKSGVRLFQTDYLLEKDNFVSDDLTKICPDIITSDISAIAVQRQPDTRVHCVLSDGTVAVLILDQLENVKCWVTVTTGDADGTNGVVEDVFVLPGDVEDSVYYCVKRVINGSTVRYVEKWALESECQGSTLNKQADSFTLYSGASTTTITGLSHLEGEEVVVWGNGADLGTYTVTSSQITGLTSAVTSAVVGLGYTAQYKSVKISAIYDRGGTPLTQPKIVTQLGVILKNTHYQGLTYGPTFDWMDSLPLIEGWTATATNTVWSDYDEGMFEFDGEYSPDARICFEANAPRPCTLIACVVGVQLNEKNDRDTP